MSQATMFRTAIVVVAVSLSQATIFSEETITGVRTVVQYSNPHKCATVTETVTQLGSAYFSVPTAAFLDRLGNLLAGCQPAGLPPKGGVMVIVMPVKVTQGAEDPTLIHIPVRKKSDTAWELITDLGGATSAVWMYLSDDARDVPRTVLVSTKIEHPILAQLGAFSKAVLEAIPMVRPPSVTTSEVHVRTATVVLPFRRSNIVESDYLQVAGTDAYKEITGGVTLSNTPATWINLNAAAGVLTGRLRGAERVKVEDDKYASDPLPRTAVLVGATFHLPYDAGRPVPSARERVGLFLGVLVTPAAGFFAGPSVGWRGFALTAGYARMWIDTAPGGRTPGEAAVTGDDLVNGQQLVRGTTSALLIGGTYVFGG